MKMNSIICCFQKRDPKCEVSERLEQKDRKRWLSIKQKRVDVLIEIAYKSKLKGRKITRNEVNI